MIGTNAFQVRRSPISVGSAGRRAGAGDRQAAPDHRPRTPRSCGARCPMRRPWRSSRAGPRRSATSSYRDRTVGNVLVFGVTPPYQIVQDYQLRRRRAAHRARRARAAAGGGASATRSPRSCSTSRARAVGKRIRIAGREVAGEGRDRQEGPGAGPVVRRFVLLPFTTFESFYGRRKTTVVSVKMADRRGDRAGAMARAEEAMRIAHRLRPGEDERLHGGQGRRAGGVLAAADPGAVHRHPRRGLHRHRGGRHRHHEHHADERDRADPRDRHPQVARAPPGATSGGSSWSRRIVLSTLGGAAGRARRLGAGGGRVDASPRCPPGSRSGRSPWRWRWAAGAGIVFGVYPAARAARLDPDHRAPRRVAACIRRSQRGRRGRASRSTRSGPTSCARRSPSWAWSSASRP